MGKNNQALYEKHGVGHSWRIAKRKKQIVTFCSVWFSILALVFGITSTASAGPTDGQITYGTGAISYEGLNTNIQQGTQRLDIKWGTFSTDVNEAINFNQPNSTAVAINRVVGGLPSQLRGALNANGRVFVFNDSGITFYGSSQVNVGSLVASTAKDVAFDGDKMSFIDTSNAQVINQGNITVSNGGFAVLAAPYVQNSGIIQADLGEVVLASTTAYTIDLRGDNLITFAISPSTAQKLGVDNSGTVQARSGTINISAAVAADIVSNTVNLDGVVDVSSFDGIQDGGKVSITSKGDVNLGDVAVSANGGVGGNGGEIITWADGTNRLVVMQPFPPVVAKMQVMAVLLK